MHAAKIFAIAVPAAVEADMPVSWQRQIDIVMVEVLVAEIDNYQHVVASATLIPAVVTDNAVVVVGVEKGGRIALQTARCIVSVVP